MKKAIILAIISIVIIVGVVSILSINPIFFNGGLVSTSNSTEKEEVIPKGRDLSVELEEKMGFANP